MIEHTRRFETSLIEFSKLTGQYSDLQKAFRPLRVQGFFMMLLLL